MIAQLPALGVGASLSLSSQPDPVALAAMTGGPDFIEYAGQADVVSVWEEVQRVRQAGIPVLYHPSCLNFCGSFANSATWLRAAAEQITAVGSPWFAQDCAYCFWQQGHGYSTQLGYFIPPILNQASLNQAILRMQEVTAAIQGVVAIEPPPMAFCVGSMPLMTFFAQLANAVDCAILLDMGHLVSYELASGQKIREQLTDFPWQRVVEVHIAGGRIETGERGPIYLDAHELDIQDASWHMLMDLLPLMPNVKAVCYECEGIQTEDVLSTLAQLRQIVQQHSISPSLLARCGVE